ncbi:MAG TPA: HD domain-containing protein [Fimbriimonadaceae bacterium]|nr:HD domain-containing protein [Fimbriimonadaceae bacterium]HRE93927.1 HD domain-containing protein [Fimbriimonadaceae bacterium]
MRQRWKLPPRVQMILMVFIGILMLGGPLILAFYSEAKLSTENQLQTEMRSYAMIAASLVDADEHEKLVDASQIDSDLYHRQNERIRTLVANAEDIAFVYTIRRIKDKYYFVLDPTPAGDLNGDAIDDKSYLMEEYEDFTPEMVACFETGQPTVDQVSYTDRWGTWRSAYAPIKNKEGEVVAVVGVDRSAAVALQEQSALFLRTLIYGFIFAMLALGMAVSTAAVISKGSKESPLELIVARVNRTVVENIILALGVVLLVQAGISQFQIIQNSRNTEAAIMKLESLRLAQNGLKNMRVGHSAFETNVLIERLVERGEPKLAANLQEVVQRSITSREAGLNEAQRMQMGIDSQRGEISTKLDAIGASQNRTATLMFFAFLTAAVIGTASILFLRLNSQRERRLRETEINSLRMQNDYRTLVESLPLGLALIRDGRNVFDNGQWSAQLLRPRPPGALVPTALDNELDRVAEGLKQSENRREPWSTVFTAMHEGSSREIEVRSQPIYDGQGSFRHLLTFLVDVTDLRQVSHNLERKNAEIESTNKLLTDALGQLEANFESIVRALVRAVEAKDPYTAGHSERVMQYSLWIADEMGLGDYEKRLLEMGCLVHDIGKIGIPDNVLTKPGKLTDEEFEMIRMHPVYGANIVQNVDLFRECLPIIRWHHEKLDGSGYPDRLAGDDIPFLVRIATVADIFDAITSTRSYRVGMALDRAISILDEDTNKGYLDAEVVAAFKQVIARNGVIPQTDDLPQQPAA